MAWMPWSSHGKTEEYGGRLQGQEEKQRRSIGPLRCVFMPDGRAGCRKRLLCYSAALFSSFCNWALMNSLPATTEPVSSIVSLPSMSLT